MTKERDPLNLAYEAAPFVELRKFTCDTARKAGRGGAEHVQDVSGFLRCCPRPDAASAADSALELNMAQTNKCGTVTNVADPTTTARKMVSVADLRFQQAKRTRRRKRSRPADKLRDVGPHGRLWQNGSGRTSSHSTRSCWTYQLLARSLEHSWYETPSRRTPNSTV